MSEQDQIQEEVREKSVGGARPARHQRRARCTGQDQTSGYLVEFGQRVPSMRAVRGMSRKVLAAESGVSERYVAQLESGLGNLSIMLLRRVAGAAGARLEDLVADPSRQPHDWPLIRELMRKAAPELMDDVKVLLSGHPVTRPANAQNVQVDRVALIGLRGAGKSTLGQLVANKLGWRFVELNREIENEAGLSIGEVFSLYDQDGYRRYEQSALERVVGEPGALILAAGGGIASDPVTFERLLARFFTVWVKASPAEHMSSTHPATTCAPTPSRPPLPAPNVRDDRDTPLMWARNGAKS